jgi:hypothetical protein
MSSHCFLLMTKSLMMEEESLNHPKYPIRHRGAANGAQDWLCEQLGIAATTWETHRQHLYLKLAQVGFNLGHIACYLHGLG